MGPYDSKEAVLANKLKNILTNAELINRLFSASTKYNLYVDKYGRRWNC